MNLASAVAFYMATFFLHYGTRTSDLPSHFYAFFRYLIGLVLFGTIFFASYRNWKVPRSVIPFLGLRAVFNLLALFCFYQSVATGEAGKANVLNMTYPAFVALVSWPLLRERVSLDRVLLVGLAIAGMILQTVDWNDPLSVPASSDLWGLASAVAAGVAVASLRGAARAVPVTVILFWVFAIGAAALAPFNVSNLASLPSSPAWLFVVASAVAGVVGQWCLSVSYRSLDATTGSIISTSRIPIALFVGLFVLEEGFVLVAWLGAGLILLANVLLAFRIKSEKDGGLIKPTAASMPESVDQLKKRITELAESGCQGNVEDFSCWVSYMSGATPDGGDMGTALDALVGEGVLKPHSEITGEYKLAGDHEFPEQVSYSVSGRLNDSPIQMVRSRLESFLRCHAAGEEDLMDLSIATTEAMENAVKYSDHTTIEVNYAIRDGEFSIKIVNPIGRVQLEQDIEAGKYTGSITLMRGMMVMVKLFDDMDIDISEENRIAVFTARSKLKAS